MGKHRGWVVAVLVLLLACGGGDDDDGGGGTPPPPASNQVLVIITDTGLSPRAINIRAGGAVVFRNDSSRAHQLSSDPHPAHTQCPEYNNPVLQQGDLFTATAQARASPCGLHDHLEPDNTDFRATVTVTGS